MNTTCYEAVRAALNQREALLALAAAIDARFNELEATDPPADDWETAWTDEPEAMVFAGEDIIEIPAVDDIEQARRRDHASGYVFYSYLASENMMEAADFEENYAKGGPVWFYHYDRDAVMQLPRQARQDMVADIERNHSPALAHEIGRDILKFGAEDGNDAALHTAERVKVEGGA